MKKVALLVGLLMVLPAVGVAHEQTDLDPNDSASPVDTAAARLWDRKMCTVSTHPGRSTCHKEMDLRLVAYEPWSSGQISGGKNFITFEFNFDRDPVPERCVVIRAQSEPDGAVGRPYASLYRECTYFADTFISNIGRTSQPDAHSIRVKIRRKGRLIPSGTGSFRWRSVTSFQQEGHEGCPPPEPHADGGYGTCADSTAWRRHRR
jgi:hypothetical protein